MKKGISVCFVIRNGLINGYPFMESLESCLPIADEIIISEGNSRDETMEYLIDFKDNNKNVFIYHDDWNFKSFNGEIISEISNKNLRRCEYEWIYYLQADEIIHSKNISYIKAISKNNFPINSVEFWFAQFIESWDPILPNTPSNHKSLYNAAIRMVRNREDIFLRGDGWTFGGNVNPVAFAELAPEMVYHFAWVFPKNIDLKKIETARIRTGEEGWEEIIDQCQKRICENNYIPLNSPENLDLIPEIIRPLIGKVEYQPIKRIKKNENSIV